jgi:DNA-binding GntR family transcriptional regulator
VPVGSPVLRCERVTRDVDGNPVLLSVHVFPSHLTEFVVDLPSPTGLSLVE